MSEKVMCAMSGGLDSSVSAYLLKEKGYEVVGVTMCLGVKEVGESSASCCGAQAIEDAKKVCRQLDIPHYVFDFSGPLQEHVIAPFVEAYGSGRTPNPCVECNRYLKFGMLLDRALALGFDRIATGHYACIMELAGQYYLHRSTDHHKDQTYFLHAVKKETLPKILFPVGVYEKSSIREMAKKIGLTVVAEKRESYDVCFIPDGDLKGFMSHRLAQKPQPGPILDREGKVLGEHKGFQFYTIGQRGGLGVAGGKKLYITALDPINNTIRLGERSELFSSGLVADRVNLFTDVFPDPLFVKVRYSHKEAPCKARLEGNKLHIDFHEKQEAVTPGQSVVLYHDDRVIAGGLIENVY